MKSFITLNVLGLSVAVLLLTPSNAWAYIDPGTGSYLFQLVAAGFLAGAYTMRRYWDNIKQAVRRSFGRRGPGDTPNDGQ
jgi:hypothetical protein